MCVFNISNLTMEKKMKYPFTKDQTTSATVNNGDFTHGKFYECTYANPKAKANSDGSKRFTQGMVYMCVANDSAHAETDDVPPTFLIDNTGRIVNCGSDAKLKSQFVLRS